MATSPSSRTAAQAAHQLARVDLLTELGVSAPASRAREGNEFG